MKYLKISFIRKDGRNKEGRITSYHKGGGHSRKYRIVDWSHMIKGVFAYVLKKEYDPFRNVDIYLVYYQNGCFSYHLAIQGVLQGMYLYSGKDAPLWLGNNLPLYRFPAGSFVSNLNSLYGKAAGVRCQILKHFGKNSLVKLPSGEKRIFRSEIWSTYGRIGKVYSKFEKKRKAGNNRNKGKRPCVRGVAMNPIDHPHGGGEGKTSGGRLSVTPWGKLTKGKKTKKK